MPALNLSAAEAQSIACLLLEDEPDHYYVTRVLNAKDRNDLAGIAMNIPLDRYGAGSTGARFALVVLMLHGVDAAMNFVKDIECHEES